MAVGQAPSIVTRGEVCGYPRARFRPLQRVGSSFDRQRVDIRGGAPLTFRARSPLDQSCPYARRTPRRLPSVPPEMGTLPTNVRATIELPCPGEGYA